MPRRFLSLASVRNAAQSQSAMVSPSDSSSEESSTTTPLRDLLINYPTPSFPPTLRGFLAAFLLAAFRLASEWAPSSEEVSVRADARSVPRALSATFHVSVDQTMPSS